MSQINPAHASPLQFLKINFNILPSMPRSSKWSLFVRIHQHPVYTPTFYRCADKSLARSGRKQTRKHVRDARDFNNIETRAAIKFLFFFLQGKAPKEIQAILTETLACFLPGRANDLSAPLYFPTLYTRLQYTLCLCSQCNTFRNFEIVPARRKQM